MPPSWSVVSTVDEPAPLVVAFALHHLEIGAERVHLFLDAPNPEAEAALAGIAQVRLTLCDEGHWAASNRKKKPKLHPGRQLVNANIAYAQTRSDWLLHCDCDEFLRDGAALTDELSALLPRQIYLRLMMAERAYTTPPTDNLFDGVFRFPLNDFALSGPAIYGPIAPMLKDGVTGHRAGKAVVRTGLPLSMGIHSPEMPPDRPAHRNAQTRLLHFDGLTRLHYMIKLLKRAHEPPSNAPPRHGAPRIAQFGRLRELIDTPEAAQSLVEDLKTLNPAQLAELRAMDSVDERPFYPLGQNPLARGLTVSAIDAALREKHREFLTQHAPGLLGA